MNFDKSIDLFLCFQWKYPFVFNNLCDACSKTFIFKDFQHTFHYDQRSRKDISMPVIITDVVDKWPAINWTKRFFLQNYAEEKVMVKAVVNSKPAAVAVDMDTFISELDTSGPNGWTYLEDELFIVTRPELKKDIGPNVYAEENFFNLFPDEVRPWDCLMLWGSQFSRSSLHMDPYNWTATNAVLYGHKSWMSY